MKLLVTANSKKHLNNLLNKDIDGIILSIKDLSVNDSFYIAVKDLDDINFKNKEVFMNINKIMHNSDLPLLKETLMYLKNKKIKIMFYDMAVYNIAKDYDMVSQLIIMQDHLNASTLSNNFYNKLGISGSYITSDITKDELLEIKNTSKMSIFFTVYGYLPIFYSRRYLITNYLKFINKKGEGKYHIISDNNTVYPICEEAYGTTIYTSEPVDLINYLDELKSIDYLVLKSNMIDEIKFNKVVDRYLNRENINNPYVGFFTTKTIYRVKGDNNEKN